MFAAAQLTRRLPQLLQAKMALQQPYMEQADPPKRDACKARDIPLPSPPT